MVVKSFNTFLLKQDNQKPVVLQASKDVIYPVQCIPMLLYGE